MHIFKEKNLLAIANNFKKIYNKYHNFSKISKKN